MAKVLIPSPLRQYTENKSVVEVDATDVGKVLRNLVYRYPLLEKFLYTSSGDIQPFVNIYLEEDNIKSLNNEDTPVKSTDTISIIPAIAGGYADVSHNIN